MSRAQRPFRSRQAPIANEQEAAEQRHAAIAVHRVIAIWPTVI
jgi:hypothetical protein